MESIIRTIIIFCVIPSALLAAEQRPNIVFILSDDQAWMDYGYMGHPDIKTPHLDKLASRSLVFERGYVAAPLCRPSLASLATGLYPFQHGITGNDVNGGNNRAALDAPMKAAFHKHPSFIKMLTVNGYLAHQSGKWWEGSFADGGFTHGMTHGDPKRGGRHGDSGLKIGRKGLEPITEFINPSPADTNAPSRGIRFPISIWQEKCRRETCVLGAVSRRCKRCGRLILNTPAAATHPQAGAADRHAQTSLYTPNLRSQ